VPESLASIQAIFRSHHAGDGISRSHRCGNSRTASEDFALPVPRFVELNGWPCR
jgi:hypothetical protein